MNKVKLFAYVVLIQFLFQVNTFAWGDTGHMAVAQIAYQNLDSPAKKNRADELVGLIRLQNADSEKTYDFVTSACWMDDIRDSPMFEPLKDWHFITQRYIIDNAVADEEPPPVNAASILNWLGSKLNDEDEADLKKAYYLAELNHLIGDIHQPLHSVTRYTPDRKGGDRGGNFFPLDDAAPRKNLHSYWDAGGGLFGFRDVGRPLNETRRKTLAAYANKIMNDYPRSAMIGEINDLKPNNWAKESFNLAKINVYQGIKEDVIPSDAYRANAQKVSARRIALAGYRLAAILNKVL